jgi:hypothetical protein
MVKKKVILNEKCSEDIAACSAEPNTKACAILVSFSHDSHSMYCDALSHYIRAPTVED